MPRPKRTKVAPSVPASRVAKPIPARKVVEDPIEDDSDQDRRCITSAKRVRRSNVEKPTGSATKVGRMSSGNDPREKSLETMRKRRDEAIERLEAENESTVAESVEQVPSEDALSSSPAVEMGRKEIAPAAENSMLRTGNFKRRARQPSILGRGRESRASSIDSDLAEATGLTHVPRIGDSAVRPGARRRARQPSILGRANSRVRSSSLELEMDVGTPANVRSALKGGMFRRRARQPSILGTAQKTRQAERSYDLEDEEDFDPEDESTPLNLSKTRSAGEGSSQSASSAENPRKRKISPIEVTRDSSPLQISDDAEEEPLRSSPSARSSPIPSVVDRQQTPELLSETMAPPLSSSPAQASPSPPRPSHRNNSNSQPPAQSTRRQPSRKTAQPAPDSLPSSPPSLTHSPNGPTHAKAAPKRQTRQAPDPISFSTAQLQALLPRRRQRTRRNPNDPFAVESSGDEVDVAGLGSDDDELSHLTVGTRNTRRTPAPAAPRRVTKLKPSRKAADKGKGKASTTAASKHTYGAARSRRDMDSDKENEQQRSGSDAEEEQDVNDSLGPMADDDEDGAGESPENSQELEARVGKELKVAKRKFEVVDKWELEFEEVTASSSSPWDAR